MTEKLFRVNFMDGNEKLLGADNMVAVINYLVYQKQYNATDIIKIEEVIEEVEEAIACRS